MIRLLAIALFFLGTCCFADVATEPWPKSLRDFSEPSTHLVRGFKVTVREAADQYAGGSGGSVYDITVRQARTGTKRTVNDQCVGVRVLEFYHGWPQLEVWGRGGGGSWSRSLYRCTKHSYEYMRTDEFTEIESAAKDKTRTTTMPKVTTTLFFVESRLPARP